MSEKLQKVLAAAGYGSRRELESMIEQGRIRVNGQVAKLGERVDITHYPKIQIDDRFVVLREPGRVICRVLAYYKQEGEVSTRQDPEGRPTVFDRLPKTHASRWISIGRLDINTSGLLLFTTDGELANRLMHPSHEIEREYAVRVFGTVTEEKLKLLRTGVQLEDGRASFNKLTFQGGEGINQWYNVTLTEGRNREVRRLWEKVDVKVSRLIRVRYGNITLPKSLPRGGWIELSLNEVNSLRESAGLTAETQSKVTLDKERRNVKKSQIRRAIKRQGMQKRTKRK